MKYMMMIALMPLLLVGFIMPVQANDSAVMVCQPIELPTEPAYLPTSSLITPALNSPASQFPDADLLHDAALLLGEGDRLAEEGKLEEAREKWLDAAELYSQTDDKLAEANAYIQFSDSYAYDFASLLEAATNPARFSQVLGFYRKALFLSADVYETLIRKDLTFDETVLAEADGLYTEAVILFEGGNCEEATPLFAEARTLYASQEFGSGEIRVMIDQAICAFQQQDFLPAFLLLSETLLIVDQLPLGDSASEQYLEGVHQFERGDVTGAVQTLTAVRDTLSVEEIEAGDSFYASVTHALANSYALQGDFARAEELYREALPLFIEADNEYTAHNIGTTHHNLANVYVMSGRYVEAIELYAIALDQWDKIGDIEKEVHTLSGWSIALMEQGDYSGALALLHEAQTLYERLSPNAETEGDLLTNIGRVYFGQGQYAEALALHEQALELREGLENPIKRIESLNNIASVQLNLGDVDATITTYDEVVRFANENNLPLLADRSRVNQATALIKQSEFQRALAIYLDVQRHVVERGELTYATVLSSTIGTTYAAIGDEENAQRYLESAMNSADSQGTLELSALARSLLGDVLGRTGTNEQADSCLAQAQAIFEHIGNPTTVAVTLGNRALLALRLGDFEKAQFLAEEAATISAEVGNVIIETESLLLLGTSYLTNDEHEAAIATLERARTLAEAQGDLRLQAAANALLSFSAGLVDQDWESADTHIEAALENLEQLQSGLTVGALKTFFFDGVADIYVWAAIVAVAQDDLEKSFYRLEQARARTLLDQLITNRVDLFSESDPLLLEEASQKRLQLEALREQYKVLTQSSISDGESIQALATVIQEQEAAYTTLRTQIEVQNPAASALVSTEVATVAEIQQLLDPETTLVSYFVASNYEFASAFVISAENFSIHSLPATPDELTTALTTFRENDLADPTLSNAYPDSLQQLQEWLIAPFSAELNTPHLLIVPHGDLHYLPFAALTDGEHYLGKQFVLSNLPSATTLRFLTIAEGKPQSVLALGNPRADAPNLPDLRHAEKEAETVANLFGAMPLVRDAATEVALLGNSEQDIWHIAAHGVYNTANPLFSTIHLTPGEGQDGRLDVHEIYGLDLETQLVVLSACETQVGTNSQGDDVVALNRAFLHAGVPSVVATLWPVDDEATAQLMTTFYRNLKVGMGTAQALQQAQNALRTDYPHPLYWAGFVLTGDSGDLVSQPPSIPSVDNQVTVTASQPNEPERNNGLRICATALLPVPIFLVTLRRKHRKSKKTNV